MARSAKKTIHSKASTSGVSKLKVVADDVFRILDRSEENAQCRRELVASLRYHFGAKRTAQILSAATFGE
jgi:hypothetical protein